MAQAQVDARQRLAFRLRGVDAQFKEVALAQQACEHAQLRHGAAALAFDARARQAGFGGAAVDQGIAQRQDIGGDRFEEIGAPLGCGFAIGVERLPGQCAGLVELFRRGAAEGRFECRAGACVDGVDSACAAAYCVAADQQFP
ncbi:hypothetical protein D3C72_1702840 [compost metagenome]